MRVQHQIGRDNRRLARSDHDGNDCKTCDALQEVCACDLNEDDYQALERTMKRMRNREEGDDAPGAAGQGRAANGVACARRRA